MCRATVTLWGHLMDNSLSNQVQMKLAHVLLIFAMNARAL